MSNSLLTKRALADALKTSMQTTAFEKITISDICKRCSMNRKSFYYHFQDKYDLVVWIFESDMGAVLNQALQGKASYALMLQLCTYFAENRTFYLNALEQAGPGGFRTYLSYKLQPIVGHTLSMETHNLLNADEVALMVSDFCLSALYQWLKRTPPLAPDAFLSELTSVAILLTGRVLELLSPSPV
ncbi:TetR family transcriptional regulator [Sphaerochaeta sp.]|jgi:probable dihydroxyacetone kinase regulator|uniref:TetR family transcriptional regulator n=1 Tax=Sphaerochaeta sp. TaxID=1972642 RepID=UPI002FC93AD8